MGNAFNMRGKYSRMRFCHIFVFVLFCNFSLLAAVSAEFQPCHACYIWSPTAYLYLFSQQINDDDDDDATDCSACRIRWQCVAATISDYNGRPLFTQKLPLSLGIGAPSNTWYLEPTKVAIPHGISIGSTVFAWHMNVTNRQTKRPTDHATPCVAIDRYR